MGNIFSRESIEQIAAFGDISEGNIYAIADSHIEALKRIAELEAQLAVAREALAIASRHLTHHERRDEVCYDWCPLCKIGKALAQLDAGKEVAEKDCPDCQAAKRHAYSDATTPGFFFTQCDRHRTAPEKGGA